MAVMINNVIIKCQRKAGRRAHYATGTDQLWSRSRLIGIETSMKTLTGHLKTCWTRMGKWTHSLLSPP